jgi:hypothetical protein
MHKPQTIIARISEIEFPRSAFQHSFTAIAIVYIEAMVNKEDYYLVHLMYDHGAHF